MTGSDYTAESIIKELDEAVLRHKIRRDKMEQIRFFSGPTAFVRRGNMRGASINWIAPTGMPLKRPMQYSGNQKKRTAVMIYTRLTVRMARADR